jgi:DNA recombination protein RmuC
MLLIMNDILLLGLSAAATLAAAWFAYRAARADKEAATAKARNEGLDLVTAQYSQAAAERDAAREKASRLEAELAGVRAAAAERALLAEENAKALEKHFAALAASALDANQQRFLSLANETFEKHRTAAQGGVKEVLAPVQEAFAKLSGSVEALEKARLADKSAMGEQARQIMEAVGATNKTTNQLLNALRASPKARGRWGEQTLRNVLELAGLAPRVDFNEQTTTQDGEGARLRPDVVINLPGGRCIVVDSKVALSGYLDAMDATDEAARETHLKKHAAELRAHVKNLSSKDYWKYVPDTADFVVLFVPGENFLAAAAERDANLFEDAIANRVIITTPSTMVALAKTVAYGWRQEDAAKNAQEIAALGRLLYERLSVMGDHIGRVGKAIGDSVARYNDLVGSVDTRVLVTARKFKELGAADAGVEITSPAQIETVPRALAPPDPPAELELTSPNAKRGRAR